MSGEQKYKEGDSLRRSLESGNARDILLFTDRQQAYFLRLSEQEYGKASSLGTYLPTALGFDEGERIVDMADAGDYSGMLLFAYANGKLAKVPAESFRTKTKRKKLTGASSDSGELITVQMLTEDTDLICLTDDSRALILHSSLVPLKQSRSTQGVSVVALRGKKRLLNVLPLSEYTTAGMENDETGTGIADTGRYRARAIPKAQVLLKCEDKGEVQLSLL